MFQRTRTSVFLLLLSFIPAMASAQNGGATVSGVVRDSDGAAIPGVTVTATKNGADPSAANVEVTGTSGEFRIGNLPPGDYVLDASLDGFQPVSRRLTLVPGQKLEVAFTVVPAFSETVEVVAEVKRTGEVAILESRREAPVVSDSISAEEIRKTPDSTAAGVVERLTGVSLVGEKYVFVRGLGERYSATTLDGSTIPTTETEKRVVPLDLFPAKLLDSVHVIKTYTPDKPGDFGSGVVEMTTTQFPSSSSLKLTLGTGHQSGTTGERFRRYAGGLSRFGSGGQPLPGDFPAGYIRRSSILNPDGFTPAELERIGESLIGAWTGSEDGDASPSTDYALTYGNTFGRLGVVFSAVSTHGSSTLEETQRFFGLDANDELVAWNDYELLTDRESATSGFVGNLSFRFDDRNRMHLNSVLTRDASSETRSQEGLQTNSGGDIRDYRVRYQLGEVLSTRLRGDHNLGGPALGSLVEWNLARSTATNDSDLRENIYRESAPAVFQMQTGFADSGKLEYFALDDAVDQAGAAWSMFFATGPASGSVKFGGERLMRTRDFAARRFRFVPVSLQGIDLTQAPDRIYTAENIGPNRFELRENTGVNDAYDAAHAVSAAYVMSDTSFGKWRIIGGARYETSDQRVTTFNPFDTANAVNSRRENADLLPSLNVVRQLGAGTNLRFAYGRSLNRPEFRELSPFAFTEVAGGRSVAGNPGLVQATIDGFDFRWETFPAGGEVVAASLFYKHIDRPIERIVQPTSDFRQSFVNADSATLYGIELEFRRSLESLSPALRRWAINANYAHIESRVTVGEHQYSVVTSAERPLEGQSDDVANAALQFHHAEWGTMVRILGAYSGRRLTEVGSFGLPDVHESPSTTFDVVLSQSLSFARGLELKIAGSNLLGSKREFVQGGRIQRRSETGRKLSLSLSYTPF